MSIINPTSITKNTDVFNVISFCYYSIIGECENERENCNLFCKNHKCLRNDKNTTYDILKNLTSVAKNSSNTPYDRIYYIILMYNFIIFNKNIIKQNKNVCYIIEKKISEFENDDHIVSLELSEKFAKYYDLFVNDDEIDDLIFKYIEKKEIVIFI